MSEHNLENYMEYMRFVKRPQTFDKFHNIYHPYMSCDHRSHVAQYLRFNMGILYCSLWNMSVAND